MVTSTGLEKKNKPKATILVAIHFMKHRLKNLCSLNLFSVLRCYHMLSLLSNWIFNKVFLNRKLLCRHLKQLILTEKLISAISLIICNNLGEQRYVTFPLFCTLRSKIKRISSNNMKTTKFFAQNFLILIKI